VIVPFFLSERMEIDGQKHARVQGRGKAESWDLDWNGLEGNGGREIAIHETASRQRRLLLGGVYSWGFSLLVDDGIFFGGIGGV
jgi:hypothetical protein